MSRFLTIVNVSPEKAKPVFNVSSIEANDQSQWLLTVENTGNRFGVLAETSWEIESLIDPSKSRELSNKEVNTMISRSLVLPKSTMIITIPALEGYDPNTVKIKINTI